MAPRRDLNERLTELAEKYLRKGSKVYVEGQLQTRKWTDNAGIEKYSTEVVLTRFRGELTMLDGAGGARDGAGGARDGGRAGAGEPAYDDAYAGGPPGAGGDSPRYGGTGTAPARGRTATNDLDDEIPF